MQERSIVIIGAGVAGLATGCYARMNGYRTHIVEMAQRPGGVCTSWRRGEYTFDGCLEWLMGSRPGSPLNRTWLELGALAGRDVVDHDEYMRVEGRDGQTLVVYTDADRLERTLCDLAPADAATSHLLCRLVRDGATLLEDQGWSDRAIHLALALPRMIGVVGTTWAEFTARYTDRFVRDALRSICDGPDMPLMAGVMMLSSMHARDAGYPVGGSLAFAQAIEQRYRELGGEVTYGARVARILTENDRAVGVELAGGGVLRADDIVSAADGHSTIFGMLDGRYVSRRIRRRYATGRLFDPLVQVSLGVALELHHEPHMVQFPLRTPAKIAGQTREALVVRHYGYDPTLAPPGKTVVQVHLQTSYDDWEKLAGDPDRYEQEKEAIADAVITALDERFPGLAAAVEVRDVATPTTWVRHTGNWRGSFEGWFPGRGAIKDALLGAQSTLPGLSHFFMVGQWATFGGLPSVAPAGRALVQQLCKRDGKRFIATVATHPPAQLLPDFGSAPTHARQEAA